MAITDRTTTQIQKSTLISRDLSWLKFNQRVLDQAKKPDRNFFDKLKFMAITSSNLDEFFMIRVGSLYNYLDYNKERVDYSSLREIPFKKEYAGNYASGKILGNISPEIENIYREMIEKLELKLVVT